MSAALAQTRERVRPKYFEGDVRGRPPVAVALTGWFSDEDQTVTYIGEARRLLPGDYQSVGQAAAPSNFATGAPGTFVPASSGFQSGSGISGTTDFYSVSGTSGTTDFYSVSGVSVTGFNTNAYCGSGMISDPGVTVTNAVTNAAVTLTICTTTFASGAVSFVAMGDQDSDLAKSRAVLTEWRPRLAERTYAALDLHLGYLLDADELRERSIAPQLGSFEELLAYLAAHRGLKPPSLGLRKDGVFSAAWSPGGKARVNLEFLGGGNVRCIAVDARPGRRKRVKGAFDLGVDRINSFLVSTRCDVWMNP